MILTSTTEPVRFVPPWRATDPDAPTFLIRAGSMRERGQLEAELAGPLRAGRVWGHELRAAVREGIVALMSDDPAFDELMGMVDGEGERTDAEQSLFAQVERILAEHYQPYRELTAQLERRRELAPIEALRRFLVGVEGVDLVITRGIDGCVSDATLAKLDPIEMLVAGNRAYELLYGGGDLEKNSEPAASSESGRETSSPDTPPAGGSSAKKRGRRTRA